MVASLDSKGSEHPAVQALIDWQLRLGRHGLPWQSNRTPYRVWLSEVMLQQTQVATVIDYFNRFMAHYPGVHALAEASEDAVLALWSGLGYYRRARHLHETARRVVAEHGGVFPDTLLDLCALPGIGLSTAGAILSLGHGKRGVILDGNVKRVLSRLFCVPGPYDAKTLKRLWGYADAWTPKEGAAVYNQGLMDLGATVCLPRAPLCGQCPWQAHCQAYRAGTPELFPQKKTTQKLPVHEKRMQVLWVDGHVGLERRVVSGIWGGLWSFPVLDAANPVFELRGGGQPIAQRALGVRAHRFTHQVWRIEPCISVYAARPRAREGTLIWYTIDVALALGLPKPVRDVLLELQNVNDWV